MKYSIFIGFCLLLFLLLSYVGLLTGSLEVSNEDLKNWIINYSEADNLHYVLMNLRLPRILLVFLMHHRKNSGIYNLGSGKARTFLDLTKNTFKAMGKKEDISFVDTPVDIRDKYQYFTEASMEKLISIGYHRPFTSLEDGVKDYVQNYLSQEKYY